MPTINGTTSRRTSNYDFYFVYSVTNDNANKRHIVNVKAYIKCISWDFETAVADPWVHIRIGSTTYNRSAAGINCNQYSLPHTYLLWEKTAYYDYSTSARSIYLRAYTDDLYVAGHGPGVCNAATTITIPARYSTSGTITGTALSESTAKVVLSGLPTAVGFTRTIKWYYKQSNASAWTLFDTTTVSGTSTTSSITKQISLLTPSTAYNVKAMIYDGTDLIVEKTGSVTTNAMAGTMSIWAGATRYAFAILSGLADTGYERTAVLHIKKSTDTEYVLSTTVTIASGAQGARLQTRAILPGTEYNFKLNVYRGTVLLKSFTGTATTLFTSASIPNAVILNAEATPFTNQVRVYWDCFEATPETSFKICYQHEGGSQVEGSLITSLPTERYTDITVGTITENVAVAITIKSYNTGMAGNAETDPFNVDIIKTFEWDTPKVQGEPFDMTADEWNMLLYCVRVKKAVPSTAPLFNMRAVAGTPFDNTMFNLVRTALEISGTAKADWDPITAADLNAIVTAINA